MQRIASMLVESNGQLLLMTRADTHLWCPPGGKVKRWEDILDGGIRELREEVGIVTNRQSCFPLTFHQIDRKFFFFYWVPIWNGVPTNLEPEKCEGISWHHTFPTGLTPGLEGVKDVIVNQLMMHRDRFSFIKHKACNQNDRNRIPEFANQIRKSESGVLRA